MKDITRVITITVPALPKRAAVYRLPVLRKTEDGYLVGYRSHHNGFFAMGYGSDPYNAYAMYKANNGHRIFEAFNNDEDCLFSFRYPYQCTPPVQSRV